MRKSGNGMAGRLTSFIVLAIFVFLAGLCCLVSGITSLTTTPALNAIVDRIQQASCTITSNEVISAPTQFSSTDTDGNTTYYTQTGYKPSISFIMYANDEKHYVIQDYSEGALFSSDEQEAQAISNKYQVGKSYPCWYDPQKPYDATLVYNYHKIDDPITVTIVLFIGAALCVALGIFIIYWGVRKIRRLPSGLL